MEPIKLKAQNLNLFFGTKQILKNVSIGLPQNEVTSLIGPSGCGKSTLLRCFNRMHDLTADARIEGKLYLNELDLHDKYRDWETDRKSTRLNSSHSAKSRMPSSA